jgi:hypothetical protein
LHRDFAPSVVAQYLLSEKHSEAGREREEGGERQACSLWIAVLGLLVKDLGRVQDSGFRI